jgi:hypothetical protein
LTQCERDYKKDDKITKEQLLPQTYIANINAGLRFIQELCIRFNSISKSVVLMADAKIKAFLLCDFSIK